MILYNTDTTDLQMRTHCFKNIVNKYSIKKDKLQCCSFEFILNLKSKCNE